MRGFLPPAFCLKASLALAILPPAAARAQQATKTLVLYYDSARTQRRAVFQARLSGPRPDTVAHGSFRRFWPAGSLMELGHFTNGLADSVWTRYYPATPGQVPALARRLPMRAGQPDGPFVVFHPNGRLAQRGTFRQGQLVDSLVSSNKQGRPRLLARFDSSRVPGLRGTFRHWGGRYTAQSLDWYRYRHITSTNPYPADRRPYWTGSLGTGRLVSTFTEHDADGQPRVRLSYTAQGQLRLATLYYPAALMRYEGAQHQRIPADCVITSHPLWQWEAVGRRPYFLQRHWEMNKDLPRVTMLQAVATPQSSKSRKAGLTGAADRYQRLLSVSHRSTTALPPLPLDSRLPECSGLYAKYLANGRAKLPPQPWSRSAYPPLGFYQPRWAWRPVRHGRRWNLGEADTTGATHRPARQRVTMLAGGRRLVETRRSASFYDAKGRLYYQAQYRALGRAIFREYYPDGGLRLEERHGLLSTRTRSWADEDGQLQESHSASRISKHPGRAIRRKLQRLHPLRSLKQKLRRFHPMQPVYRTLRRAFGKDDHHKPRPGRP